MAKTLWEGHPEYSAARATGIPLTTLRRRIANPHSTTLAELLRISECMGQAPADMLGEMIAHRRVREGGGVMAVISIHLAKTPSGKYDMRLPLPKPLRCTPDKGLVTRGGDIVQVIGFTSEMDNKTVDLTWDEWAGQDRGCDPADIYGMFPVVICDGQNLATLTVPVTHVTLYGGGR